MMLAYSMLSSYASLTIRLADTQSGYCLASGTEYRMQIPATATEELPTQYTGCHSHGASLYDFQKYELKHLANTT
jgi:hypothetical protein